MGELTQRAEAGVARPCSLGPRPVHEVAQFLDVFGGLLNALVRETVREFLLVVVDHSGRPCAMGWVGKCG